MQRLLRDQCYLMVSIAIERGSGLEHNHTFEKITSRIPLQIYTHGITFH